MATRVLNVLLRVALLVAIIASTAMFVDYQGQAAFCGGGSGCAEVRSSAFSSIGGVGLPTIGLGVFTGLFAAAVAMRTRGQHRMFAAALGGVALGAIGLIVVQVAVIGAICAWCMAVDVSATVAAGCAFLLVRREPDRDPAMSRAGWAFAGVTAVAVPLWWAGAPAPGEVPQSIARLQSDEVTDVITFTDFQCPFCRQLHQAMHERISAEPGRFRVHRKMVPLRAHPGAKPAAHAYLCAPEEQREAVADRLYSAAPEQLTRQALFTMAGELGIERASFERCFDSPDTDAAVEADVAEFQELGLSGLPATFVEDKLISGADLRAFERALAGADVRWMFGLLAVVVTGVSFASLRASRD